MRRPLAMLGLGAALLAVLAAGCSPKKTIVPNAPPDTYLFVQGALDTVNHRIHLYWYGADVDGAVVAYEYRFLLGSGPADPPWQRIVSVRQSGGTDSIFTVPTYDSLVVSPVFQIRAIDDDGAVDETPAAQQFFLRNLPPMVTISNPLRTTDTTYASVTIHWDTNDPDGGGPGLHYRIWLDGNAANYDSTSANTFTVPSSRFLQAGTFLTGLRTVYVQAVDDGGSIGPPDSTRWFVRAPALRLRANKGRVLVIDDVPSTGQANGTFDAFYQSNLAGVSTRLLADSGSVLRTEFNPAIFRSASDFAQTLRQFEAVVWYRGQETTLAPLVTTYQDSLIAWLESGGRLFLDGTYLVEGPNALGAFRGAFVQSHFGSDRFWLAYSSTVGDSSAGWGNRTTSRFRSSRYPGAFTSVIALPVRSLEAAGLRGFQVRDTSLVALWAMDGQLDPPNAGFEVPVGIRVPLGTDGRLVMLSLPIRAGAPASVTPIYLAMVRDLLR